MVEFNFIDVGEKHEIEFGVDSILKTLFGIVRLAGFWCKEWGRKHFLNGFPKFEFFD